jgi:hypothetical protein
VAKGDSIVQPQIAMRHALLDRTFISEPTAGASDQSEPPLRVVTLYQDPLTRYWATELWDRVGQLVDGGDIRRKSWKIADLSQADVFADAVQVAAEADVLVISVRETGALPLFLHVWIDAWMPRRAGRVGALVALIGVPAQPDTPSDRAYQYLEAVARQAGLDFLPRERKLPAEPPADSTSAEVIPAANSAAPWRWRASSRQAGA